MLVSVWMQEADTPEVLASIPGGWLVCLQGERMKEEKEEHVEENRKRRV